MKHSKQPRRGLALLLAALTLLPILFSLASCSAEGRDTLLYGKYGKKIKEEREKDEFSPKDSETHVSKHSATKIEPHEFDENSICTVCGFELFTQGLSYTMNEDNSSYTVYYNGVFEGEELIIPMKHKGFAVTDIANGGFKSSPNLARVTLPETMVEIGNEAFAFCTKLCYVTIEGNSHLWRIGAHAFEGTGRGTYVDYDKTKVRFQLPPSLAIIDDAAFEDSGLLVLGLPEENVFERIGAYAFHKASIAAGSSLTLGKSLTELGDFAVYPNYGLFELRFTEDCPIEEIPDDAFCGAITTLFLSPRIARVGANNFLNISTIILPSDSALTEVADSAFEGHRPLIEEFLQAKQGTNP